MRWFGWLREPDYSWPNPPRPLPPNTTLCSQANMWNTDRVRLCAFPDGCGPRCVHLPPGLSWRILMRRLKGQKVNPCRHDCPGTDWQFKRDGYNVCQWHMSLYAATLP